MRYASFMRRFVAYFIDGIVVGFLSGVLHGIAAVMGVHFNSLEDSQAGIPSSGGAVLVMFLSIVTVWFYFAGMESSSRQATVGKSAMGIVVASDTGARISFLNATGRHFAKMISAMIFFAGFIVAAFTERKQALHDLMARTIVVMRD